MNRQTASRRDGERRAQVTLIRILCAVSIWRTAMTRLLPLCGGAAWWVTLVCLMPGFLVAALLRGTMALTRTTTLNEAARACLGVAGGFLLSLVLAALLLLDGVTSITALITLFTEGLGTRGTQLTLAILTGVVLLFSLHREGLARAAHFLRWGMVAAAMLLAACLLTDARLDSFFPLYGEGDASILAALKAGGSLAWPVSLLLTLEPPIGQGKLRSAILPAFAAVAALLVLAATVPHELLIRQEGMAGLLLLPAHYASNALRVLAMCLTMLAFFLSIGASAQLGTASLCMPWQRVPAWLPYAVLAGMFLTQAADVSSLWDTLQAIEPWLLTPLAGIAILCLTIALIRRKAA